MINQESQILPFPTSAPAPDNLRVIDAAVRIEFPIAMRAPLWLKRAREIVETRFLEPLSLAEIASAVGVHLVHLSREFHRYNQCTVGELIRRRRVEYACDLLTHSKQSLAEIALTCCFSDQSHFSMMFKRQTGITPSKFRKRSRALELQQQAVFQTAS
jgi:AraC-like DNA-binding protein